MTDIVFFKIGKTVEKYGSSALTYIRAQKVFIGDAAYKVGMPQIDKAIAGAMAEENDAYNILVDPVLDSYALSGLTAADLAGITVVSLADGWNAPLIATVSAIIAASTRPPRSHQEWVDLYNQVNEDKKPEAYEKITNPVLMDLGKANIKMATAIGLLINPYLQNQVTALGLSEYQDDYQKLANDLVYDTVGLTAKIYGLMIFEADQWYRAHNAYGNDWDSLPQEIKDALYISYTNIGKGGMEKIYAEATNKGKLPYEPLPALGTAGGLNHLNNAKEIATAIGVQNYGDVTFVDTTADWVQFAKEESDKGTAYREAIYKLRPFVVQDGTYDSYATDRKNFSDMYLQDRVDMLSWLVKLKFAGVRPDGNSNYNQPDATGSYLFEENASGMHIRLGADAYKLISFGDARADTLIGGNESDHLYGMDGNDTLNGGKGDDYLEGGKGQDSMYGGDGNDTFGIVGTDSAYDTFMGGSGSDTIQGGKGNDTIRVTRLDAANSIERIDGSGGTDIIAGTDNDDLIDLTGITVTGVNRIEGGNGADVIKGTSGNDVLYGGSKDNPEDYAGDRLEGGAGNDEYHVGIGDIISDSDGQGTIYFRDTKVSGVTLTQQGNTGAYTLKGADTTAIYDANAKTLQVFNQGGSGPQFFTIENFSSGNFGISLEKGSQQTTNLTLNGTPYRDEMGIFDFGYDPKYWKLECTSFPTSTPQPPFFQQDLPATAPRMKISGGDAGDFLFGFSGHDEISGGGGGDIIIGNLTSWNDKPVNLRGPLEGDLLDGGAGNDWITGSGGDDQIIGGDGNDFLSGLDSKDTLTGGAGNDVLAGGSHNDILFGGDGNDILMGDAGNDWLDGGAGNDILDGGIGIDSLFGGDGNDDLSGGDGNDWLVGDNGDLTGSGNDTLSGGAGENRSVPFFATGGTYP